MPSLGAGGCSGAEVEAWSGLAYCLSTTRHIAAEETRKTIMSKKKDRAFFLCPRWNEVAPPSPAGAAEAPGSSRVHPRIVAAIASGQPVARSTLRNALLATRLATGAMFDIDTYIVDRRTQ